MTQILTFIRAKIVGKRLRECHAIADCEINYYVHPKNELLSHLITASLSLSLLFQAALAGDKYELGAAFKEVSFPVDATSGSVPRLLRCAPEFFVENLCEHLLLARRFCPGHFEESGGDALASVLNFILGRVQLHLH